MVPFQQIVPDDVLTTTAPASDKGNIVEEKVLIPKQNTDLKAANPARKNIKHCGVLDE